MVKDMQRNHETPTYPGSVGEMTPNDFQMLSESLGIRLFIVRTGIFVLVSELFSHTLGYDSPKELIERSFSEIIHPEDRASVLRMLKREKNNRPEDQQPVRIFKKDGATLWMLMEYQTIIYTGEPAVVGHLTEVTSIKESEKSLEESLEKYRTIVNEVEDGVSEVDLKGNFTLINEAGARMWGIPANELVGKNYRSFLDEKTADFLYQSFNNIYKTGTPDKSIIYDSIRKDGKRRVIDDSVSLIKEKNGTITGFRTVSRDITERRLAAMKMVDHRMRLEAIFRSVKDAIITIDPELRVIEANTPTENICGINAKNIVGKVFAQYPNPCNKSCCEVLRQTLEMGVTIKEYHIECNLQRRHQQIVSVSSSPLLDFRGNAMGAVLVIRDVTLLKDLERELRERHQFQKIIGKSKKMQDIYALLEDLANLETTVLVTGESGTGKDLIARALHYSGHRAFKPFISVNCSALAESLLESELFGHVKGAFTGAISDKPGRFQAADEGTILLDEIGDISPLIQLKLLRVLQEKEFERVGESTPRKVDVRVIACTNKNLKDKVRRGEFREDLYYRLKVMELYVPPLRERREDLPLLVDHFCTSFNLKFQKHIEGLSSEVLGKFMDYYWPGNIRELEHVMERAFILCHGKVITLKHIPLEIRTHERSESVIMSSKPLREPKQVQEILDALNKTRWNKTGAAQLLGISRRTLYRKIDEYKLNGNLSP